MSFYETNSLSSGNMGTFAWVQIIGTDNLQITAVESGSTSTTTISGVGEDTQFPDDIGTNAGDSPASPLLPLEAGETSENDSRTFAATMYLIWQPTTNMVGSDNVVWIPLRGINWNWSGTATNNGSGWGLQSSINSSSSLTNDFNITNEVQWTQNVTNR
ncbi:MAG: hypothetical protein LV480_13980, partial [Methylacidiphilales bacterium]|nr:hypothetical protein [Candidatus Methylacidiphilales bacterium]